MKSLIEPLLDKVAWKAVPAPAENPECLPYPTHSGELNIGGVVIECHLLNDGRRVLSGEAVERLFGGLRDGV